MFIETIKSCNLETEQSLFANTMNFTTAARRLLLATPLLAASTNVAAFSSRQLPSAFVGRTATSTRSFRSTASLNMANVLKLSDPQSELLDEVDVFIFDCDGVIWRVG